MDLSNIIYIVAGGALLLIFLVVLARKAKKKHDALRKQLFQEVGFYEIPDGDGDIRQKVAGLRHQWNEKNRIGNVYHRSEWGYKLYVFDLIERTGESTRTSRDMALLISQDYKIPRFRVMPKPEVEGVLASLANRALVWVASRSALHVTFPHHPKFDAVRALFGDDEAALRECFTDHRLDQLVSLPSVLLEGNQDAILFQQVAFEQVKQTDQERLHFVMQTARSLHDIFRQA